MPAGFPGRLPGEALPELDLQGPGAVARLLGGAGLADTRGQQPLLRPARAPDQPVAQDLPDGVPAVAVRGPDVPVPDGTQQNMCVEFKYSLGLTLSMIRSLMDLLYAVHILIRFRTAFIARVRQRGARHPASQDRQEVPFEDILVGSRHRAATATGSVCFSRPRACSFAKCSVNKQYV
jgi:hypothetical protein